jgi:hypothetical protein
LALFTVANDVSQSEYTQYRYSGLQFTSYYFITWFTYVWLLFSLPVYVLCEFIARKCYNVCTTNEEFTLSAYRQLLKDKLNENPDFSWKRYAIATLSIGSLNFFSTYAWYIALGRIPVSITFVLGQSEVVFVVRHTLDISISHLLLVDIVHNLPQRKDGHLQGGIIHQCFVWSWNSILCKLPMVYIYFI